MAQFSELSGGFGSVSSKTVIFGNNPKLITEILFVLSYFIRCSSVGNKRKGNYFDSLLFFNLI